MSIHQKGGSTLSIVIPFADNNDEIKMKKRKRVFLNLIMRIIITMKLFKVKTTSISNRVQR